MKNKVNIWVKWVFLVLLFAWVAGDGFGTDLGVRGSDSVKAWEVLRGDELARNIEALETIDFYRKYINDNTTELAESFRTAANKEDWFSAKISEIRSKARGLPGTSTGDGIVIEGQWMRGTDGNLGLFPKRIADALWFSPL